MNDETVKIIGAGLAGCEAAWILAENGINVELYEMKPEKYSPAHSSANFAELICSNSFKAMRLASAGGLLKEEMRIMGSLLLECADETQVPAGGALAVDREKFAELVTSKIEHHNNIMVMSGEVTEIPDGNVIIATGPLTSDKFAEKIGELCGTDYLSFYDAAAPIVEADSIDMDKAFFAARYDRGDADYINCPFNEQEYEDFHNALVNAETVELKSFEKNMKVYEGCMPIEVMAKRGKDTLRFGPLKPVGLTDPRTGRRPWAVVQLRKEDTGGLQYNIVGFQTNLKFPEQKKVFSMIPGLENVEFSRYGVMHRNTFIDSPRLLNSNFSMKENPNIYFAGQITGVEGYMESAASGIIAAHSLLRELKGKEKLSLPNTTMLGALSSYISNENVTDFQPMGANMGILPTLEKRYPKKDRYEKLAERAIKDLKGTMEQQNFAG